MDSGPLMQHLGDGPYVWQLKQFGASTWCFEQSNLGSSFFEWLGPSIN